MVKLQCVNCGGHINPETYVCEYCGTRYQKPVGSTPLMSTVILEHPKVQTIAAKMAVDRNMVRCLGEERAAEYCVEEMAQEIAKQLAPFMAIDTDYDPRMNVRIVRGRIRIVEPSFRF